MGVLLLQANAGKVPLKDGIVQTIVTSPPYYGLRDYGISDQIGLEPTLQEYIENLMTVFDECWRVLRDDGTMWLNLGDSYMTQPSWGRDKGTSTLGGRKTNEIPRDRLGQRKRGSHPELKIKDLMGVPWRVAFALQSRGAADWKAAETISRVMADMYDAYDGEPIPDKVLAVLERLQEEYEHAKDGSWYLRSNIIWSKPNNMPESVTDRPTKAHEFIFLLTKQPNYFYDMDAIREEHESKPETVLRDRSREG
jgi:DNA modification methylase